MTTTVNSVTNHFPSAEDGFTTTLSSTISAGATTVGLNSVAGYANGEVAVFVVAPSVASEKQVFTGIIDTAGVQVTGVKWTTGTNQTHNAGTTVVDYATATHISMMSKGLLVEHDQDGTHGAVTATSVTSAGAVSGTTVTGSGAVTGASYTQGSTRLDTGWFPGSSTWVYVSATTFTVSATEAAFMSVGTKIWLTQTTSKYFYVTGVSGATITVNGGTDYTVANAAITAPYFSNAATPFGFPHWFAYTPTWTNLTVGSATQSFRFKITGKQVHVYGYIALSSSTVGTSPMFTTPTNLSSSYPIATNASPLGSAIYNDIGTQQYSGAVWTYSTTTQVQPIVLQPSGSNLLPSGLAVSVPFSFGNSDRMTFDFIYETA